MSNYWSQLVHQLEPYVPGEQPKAGRYIKLNTNENPYPPSPQAIAAIQAQANDNLRLYPDPNAEQLKQSIADYYDLNAEQVFVGNGSDEVLAHSFVAFFKQSSPLLFPDISYSFYPVYSNLFQIETKMIPLNARFEINIDDYDRDNGGIIFPNPNAPTGIALALDSIEALLQRHAHSIIVVDEAYVDFGGQSAASLIKRYDNLVVIQTFSKSRSLAGLRVGFALAAPLLIEALERVKNSFNSYPLGCLAIAGASASIQDVNYFQSTCQRIIHTREKTQQALLALDFQVLASQSNFLFVKPPQNNAARLYLTLKTHNILVRYFNSPRINAYLRITIGTDEEMQQFIEHTQQIIG